jgi:hypothetical protein
MEIGTAYFFDSSINTGGIIGFNYLLVGGLLF